MADEEKKDLKTSTENRAQPARSSPPPEKPKTRETMSAVMQAQRAGISQIKLAGIMRYAGWTPDTLVSESQFKKAAGEWLNHPVGAGKRRKEVSKIG